MVRPADSATVEGDIVVTPIAGQYAIGRVTADGRTQAFLEAQSDCTAALKRACDLAGHDQRVFLAHSTRQTSVLVDCSKLEQHSYPSQRPFKA